MGIGCCWQLGVLVLCTTFVVVLSKNIPAGDREKPTRRPATNANRRPPPAKPSSTVDDDDDDDASLEDVFPAGGLNATSSSDSTAANVFLKKHRLIHGSKNAVTITKKEYLKKDWCKTEPFEQLIEEEGCNKKRIMNRFCYGQCNSFFIPKMDKEDVDASSFRSCAYCMPKTTEKMVVTLRCPRRNPPVKRKQVQIIKQCKCMAVKLD